MERLRWYYTTIDDKIQKWKEKLGLAEKIRGFGIIIEAILWSAINYYYLIPHYEIGTSIITSFLSNKISVENIAVLISLTLAVGFLYHIGYITEIKRKNRFSLINHPLRDTIIYNGGILFLAIFLPLLLSAQGQSNIAWYI